jgi:hypothetical protein
LETISGLSATKSDPDGRHRHKPGIFPLGQIVGSGPTNSSASRWNVQKRNGKLRRCRNAIANDGAGLSGYTIPANDSGEPRVSAAIFISHKIVAIAV